MDNLQFNNENQTPQNGGLSKDKIIKLAVAGVAAVVLVVLISVLFTSLFSSGYKKAIKNQIKLINKKTEDSLEYGKYSDIKEGYAVTELLCKYSEDYFEDNYEANYEDAVDYLKDEFGSNYKITYKVADSNKMDKDDIEDIQEYFEDAWEDAVDDFEDDWDDTEEYYEDELDLNSKEIKKLEAAMEKEAKSKEKVKVSAAYEIELECKIKGKEDDDEFDLDDIIIAKINGDWVFLSEVKYDDEKMYYMSYGITPSSVMNAIED